VESLILSLMLWLKITTTFKIPDAPPTFVIVSIDEISKIAAVKKTSKSDPIISSPLALCTNEKLYFSNELDISILMHRSIVLHELVHYMQNKCHPDSDYEFFEMQAYAVQSHWLKQNGLNVNFVGQGIDTDGIIPFKSKK